MAARDLVMDTGAGLAIGHPVVLPWGGYGTRVHLRAHVTGINESAAPTREKAIHDPGFHTVQYQDRTA